MDQMSIMLMLDEETSRATDAMAPHKSILDPNEPRIITSNASIPKPVGSTISNWVSNKSTQAPTAEQTAFMNSIAFEH